ncbi:AI-2E family transporter [uncultured Amnibacterium sp.]|uniref:AI-2E family transporter n=1 Tax=uncultured Amnibacterium sp. TaxID=1631851 RepID=UPI0035CA8D23
MARHSDPEEAAPDPVTAALPFAVRLAGAFSWRMLVVAGAAAVVVYLVILLHIVVVPLLVAILLTGLLMPVRNRLRRVMPKGIAVAITFVGLLVALAALILLVVVTIRSGLAQFESEVTKKVDALHDALSAFGISDTDLQNAIATVTKEVQSSSGAIASGALAGASTVGDIVIGLLLALFSTLFFLIDGEGIWRWVVRLAPRGARAAVDGGGRAAWLSIGEYARVQVVVALIDAIGIGLGAAILHLPFFIPIAVLVFLGAFIPFVGAVVTGGLAVIIALLYINPVTALIMLGIVILVNQLESHVLQPLLMGGAVRLHPIAVVVAVASGSVLGGITGAVFAVPLVAAANSLIKYLAGGAWKSAAPPPDGPVPQQPEGGSRPRRRRHPKPQDVTTVA